MISAQRVGTESDLSAARIETRGQSEFFPWALILILAIEFAAAIYLGGVQ
jgi:hypothetical protein